MSFVHRWCFAFALKRRISALMNNNADTFGAHVRRRKVLCTIRPDPRCIRELFKADAVKECSFDMSYFTEINSQFHALPLHEAPKLLSFGDVVPLEKLILTSVFDDMFGIKLSSIEADVLMLWDSPYTIVRLYISYCLMRRQLVEKLSISPHEMLGMFIMNLDSHLSGTILETEEEKTLFEVRKIDLETAQLWRIRRALKANGLGMEIHRKSCMLMHTLEKEHSVTPAKLHTELKGNYEVFFDSIKEQVAF